MDHNGPNEHPGTSSAIPPLTLTESNMPSHDSRCTALGDSDSDEHSPQSTSDGIDFDINQVTLDGQEIWLSLPTAPPGANTTKNPSGLPHITRAPQCHWTTPVQTKTTASNCAGAPAPKNSWCGRMDWNAMDILSELRNLNLDPPSPGCDSLSVSCTRAVACTPVGQCESS